MRRKGGLGLVCSLVWLIGAAWPAFAAGEEPAASGPAAAALAARMNQPYAQGGEKTCLTCHNQPPVTLILEGPMALKGDPRTPFAVHGCEACHGPAGDHAAGKTGPDGMLILPPVLFQRPKLEGAAKISSVAERNAVCLGCHESGLRMNWQGSPHSNNDIACTNCHTAHVAKDPVLAKQTQPKVCFTCHFEQRAQSFEYSHHPIREGKVVCSDCHNPHGSPGPKQLKEYTVNETCYTCHADKRGPLLWEHEPVRENCTNCHNPHGSTQIHLLTERMPYLCQNCHDTTFHPGEPYSGANTAGGTFAGAVIAKFQLLGRSCINCHSQIHGSNNPAGAVFLR